jgi:hypothetical protein
MTNPLGRRTPETWEHVERWPLTATTTPSKPVPVVIGVNWYSNFDKPEKDRNGRWWIGRSTDLGTIRGGHCVALEPGDDPATTRSAQDPVSFWTFYDQGREGACVGFGCSRMMSLLNRKRYDARWLWDRAKEVDEWPDTNPGDDNGTSVRAAFDVLRDRGHVVYKPADEDGPSVTEGISANRWAKSADDVLGALRSPGSSRMGAVRVLNSWGNSYPHRVWLPLEVLDRLIGEDGEAGVPVDR